MTAVSDAPAVPLSDAPVFRATSSAVFRPRHWAAFTVLTVGVLVIAWWTARWGWAHRGGGAAETGLALLVSGSFVVFLTRWLSLPLMRTPDPPPALGAPPGLRVGVATSFVPAAEPIQMLARTVAALVAMDGEHDTWVLDEGDDPAVRALCERLGARHFTRRGDARYQTDGGRFARATKHGNYNAWLDAVGFAAYDLIVNFDPDHVPVRSFLQRTLGYFADPGVGYVQAAQVYYNQPASFIARGAAQETYAYYSAIQMAGYAVGYPVVTGCHTAHRTTALQAVGGFAVHEADDLLITIHYRAAAWRGVYVPERLAYGITPVDWTGYLRQQRRWARSLLHIKFRVFPAIAARMSPVDWAVSATHGLYYLYGVATLAGLALCASMLLGGAVPAAMSGPGAVHLAVLFGSFQLCQLYRQLFLLDVRTEWGIYVAAGILRWAKWPTMILALVDAFRSSVGPYVVTPKRHAASSPAGFATIHLATAVVIITAGIAGAATGQTATIPLLVGAGLVVATALATAVTSRWAPPAPYDDALAARRLPPVDAPLGDEEGEVRLALAAEHGEVDLDAAQPA